MVNLLTNKTLVCATAQARANSLGHLEYADMGEYDKTKMLRSEMLSRIAVSLGGRNAEREFYGFDKTGGGAGGGPGSDLYNVSNVAEAFVTRYAFSDGLPAMAYAGQELSPEFQAKLEAEKGRIVEEVDKDVRKLIAHYRGAIDKAAQAMVEKGTILGADFTKILNKELASIGSNQEIDAILEKYGRYSPSQEILAKWSAAPVDNRLAAKWDAVVTPAGEKK
jgi:ATP-dependent Zn protease